VAGTEKNFGSAVPESHDFVGEGANRETESTGEAEIGKLQSAGLVDEEILGLEVPAKQKCEYISLPQSV
jgi:hypothetical protein